ncbi:MAG: DUF3307 domain-containing protein [Flavobacteriaceae bacterium]
MILLTKLFLAHIIGDFFLQPKHWVKEKEKKKLKSPKLYFHVAIHFALLFLILWDLALWPIVLVIGGLHLIVDALKLIVQKKKTKRLWFFIDQVLHVLVIITAYYVYTNTTLDYNSIFTEQNSNSYYVFGVFNTTCFNHNENHFYQVEHFKANRK